MLHRSKAIFNPLSLFAACLGFVLTTNPSFSQQNVSYTINWSDAPLSQELSDFNVHKVPAFEGAVYDHARFDVLPVFAARLPLTQFGQANVQITNAVYAPLPDA